MEKKLNVAIIGCGYWGPNLIRNFYSNPDCEVKYVCDMDESRLSHIVSLYPKIQTTTETSVVFDDDEVDAVVVATQVNMHYKLARQSLMASKHTFVEKPMAMSVKECDDLIALAAEKKLTLMVGHTFIYSSPVRKMKEVIDSGVIGKIQYISSRRLNLGLYQRDINVAWDLAPHDLSIILYLTGEKPVSVNCQGKAHMNTGIEDVTNITINFSNGGFAMVHSSWNDPIKNREMIVVGTQKMIFYDDIEPIEKIKIYDKRVETPPYYDTYAEFHYSYHHGDVYIPLLKLVEPLKVEVQHFIDCIHNKTKSLSSGENGREVIQILEAASQSLDQNGNAVFLN